MVNHLLGIDQTFFALVDHTHRDIVQRLVFTWTSEEDGACGGKTEGPIPEILVTVEFRQNKEAADTHI